MNLELALFLFNTRNSKKVCEDQMMLLPLPLQPLLPRTPMFFITPHMRRFRNLNFFVKKETCLRTLPQMPKLCWKDWVSDIILYLLILRVSSFCVTFWSDMLKCLMTYIWPTREGTEQKKKQTNFYCTLAMRSQQGIYCIKICRCLHLLSLAIF